MQFIFLTNYCIARSISSFIWIIHSSRWKYEFRIFSVHWEILQFCLQRWCTEKPEDCHKKLFLYQQSPQWNMYISIRKVVFVMKQCIQNLNTGRKRSTIFASCYSKMIRLTAHFVYFFCLGSFFYNTGIFRIKKQTKKKLVHTIK